MNGCFAQLVIGPPGSGKSTYCLGMQEFLSSIGRKVSVINLDPANDSLPYDCSLNVADLITLQDSMEKLKLGPNGGLMYCMEFLERNMEWFHERLLRLSGNYLLIDCPGQVELYTHHSAIRNIAAQLLKWNMKVCIVTIFTSMYD